MKELKLKIIFFLFFIPMGMGINMFSQNNGELFTEDVYKTQKQKVVNNLKGDLNRYLKYTKFEFSNVNTDHLFFMELQRKKYDIPKPIFYRLVYKESTYIQNIKSHVGATGYMQVMPATFEWIKTKSNLGLTDINNPYQNIKAGSFLLSYLKKTIDKNYPKISEKYKWMLVSSSYNAGYSRKFIALKHYNETRDYVRFVCKARV